MKKNIIKVMGVALALVLIASMMLFAIPTAADPYTPPAPAVSNAWVNSYPTPGLLGGWFYNPDIGSVGPIAKGIDGDLYANSVTATTDAIAAVDSITIPAGVGVDLALDIDGVAFNLTYTDNTAALVGAAIAAACATGTDFTATDLGAGVVQFTAQNVGTAYDVGPTVTDGTYFNGNTLGAFAVTSGGDDPTAQVDTVTPTAANDTVYTLRINPLAATAEDFTYTSDGTATVGEITAAFTALVNASTLNVTAADNTTDFTLTADTAGTAYSFTTASLGPGVLAIANTTAADDGAATVGTITAPAGVSAVDLTLNIDGAVINLAYGDTAAQIAAKIAAAVTAGGTVTTATSAGAVVTFTARVPGAAANGPLAMADATYSGGTVPAITLAGGVDAGAAGTVRFFKSTDGARSWFQSTMPMAYDGGLLAPAGPIVDMVCSSVNEDVLYVTDGNYVYKSVDGGMSFMLVAQASLEYALMGKCGVAVVNQPITCIDLAYSAAGMPMVFIGTKNVGNTYDVSYPDYPGWPVVGSVYYIADEAYPSEWIDLQLRCYGCCNTAWQPSAIDIGCFDVYSVGCDPNFSVTGKIYAAITTDDVNCTVGGTTPSTQIVSNTGTICMWNFVAELFYNCNVANPFEIRHASRFAFPDDFADTHTMFIGVAGTYPTGPGGDVYSVTDSIPLSPALDLNVRGYTSGCDGLYHANICSLDIMGATNSAQLIAGALDTYEYQAGTDVFYSTDGGWSWNDSDKDPTGVNTTYVLWYDTTALAATYGCNCGVSMSCGDEVGKYWNQISLIGMTIDHAMDLTHAPGYVFDDTTMYVLTLDDDTCGQYAGNQPSNSLLRWDGTFWERVFSTLSPEYAIDITDPAGLMDWTEVSPDFNTTDCLYLANTSFDIFRSTDRGCSWRILSYPCAPKDKISAWIVVDEETVLAAGGTPNAGTLYRTTRHGTRPWDEFPILNSASGLACSGVDFDLSLPRAATSDVLLGDECGQVYLSKDLGETWTEIQDFIGGDFAGDSDQTYVVFDPGYAVAGDPGENTFYAAGGTLIGRCAFNADAIPAFKQDWLYLSAAAGDCVPCNLCLASGIDAAGDTVLYVSDAGVAADPSGGVISGTVDVGYECQEDNDCTCDLDISGSSYETIVLPTPCGEPLAIVTYNLYCDAPEGSYVKGTIVFQGLVTGGMIRVTISEDLPQPGTSCVACGPDGSAVIAISSDITLSCVTDTYCPTGVWRTVDALALIDEVAGLNFTEFEFLGSALLTSLRHPVANSGFSIYPDDLWMTQGSNVLWSLDQVSGVPTNLIWMWDDPLATQVIQISPADGALLPTTTMATLEWEALDGALLYEVKLYKDCPECLNPTKMLEVTLTTSTTNATCLPIEGLLPGTKYFWKVRVACGSPEVSKWSDLRSFNTALLATGMCSPACGEEGVTLTPNFSWPAVAGATSYEIEVASDEAFANIIASGTPSINAWDGLPALEYSTTYYWRVRAVKDGVYSAWTYCLFSTMAEPEEPVEPVIPVTIVEEEITPTWIWVIIGIGGALTIAVVILIVTTRRVP